MQVKKYINLAVFMILSICGHAQPGNPGEAENNKQLVVKMNALFNQFKTEEAMQFFSDSLVTMGNIGGKSFFRAINDDILETFPDVQTNITRLWAAGDWVIADCQFTGTHKGIAKLPHHGGLLIGKIPTNKTFKVQHLRMYKISRGKIVERKAVRDNIAMYQQLGPVTFTNIFTITIMTTNKLIELVLFITTLLSGFYAGTGFFVAMGGNPAIKLMSAHTFAEYWQHTDHFMAARMRIFGPLLLLALLVSSVILFGAYSQPSFWCVVAALAIMITDIAFTLSTNHSLNQLVQSWNLDNLPPDVQDIKWRIVKAFNTRLFFMIGSFVMVLLAMWLRNMAWNSKLVPSEL